MTAGLTLLEVLAAVAILGLFYTVIAGVAIQGLRAEGEAARRLEASLLADRVMTELETGLEAGLPPPLGRSQEERDAFQLTVEVAPLELTLPPLPGETETVSSEPGLLAGSGPGAPSPLRRIDVHIAWLEGNDERTLTRTTFGFDAEAVSTELQALDAATDGSDTLVDEAADALTRGRDEDQQ